MGRQDCPPLPPSPSVTPSPHLPSPHPPPITSLNPLTTLTLHHPLIPPHPSLTPCSSDKSLRLWDAKTGEELALLEGHLDAVVCVAVAADGVRAASASLDKTVRSWDLKTEEQVGNGSSGQSYQ